MAQILPNTTGVADRLNRLAPATNKAKLGTVLAELIAAVNAQSAVIKALVTKLNADAGVTDANYSSAALKADLKKLDAR
jgi:hypothetical protein